MVCAVGSMTHLSRVRTSEHLVIGEQRTNLEAKLEGISETVGKWAYLFTVVIGLSLLIYNALHFALRGDKALFSNEALLDFVRVLILAICLLIVAIPEGMPLAISIAMAMSVDAMKGDNILIKNLESVQTCALLHEICVGKTGTLTEGKMHVASYQLINEGDVHPNDWKDEKKRAWFANQLRVSGRVDEKNNAEIKSFIIESVLANSDVRMEVDEGDAAAGTAHYVAKGQALEVAMIDFLLENGQDCYNDFISQNRFQEKLLQLPFDQELKRKTVVRRDAENAELCRVYVKGAPEEILPLCDRTLSLEVEPVPLQEGEHEAILGTIEEKIAAKGQKPLAYAVKIMTTEYLEATLPTVDEDSPNYRAVFESDLIYLGTFGLADPLRENIESSVNLLQYGQHPAPAGKQSKGVAVRIVSGDHLETAKRIAVEAGIVSAEEVDVDGVALTGHEFRRRIGPVDLVEDEYGQASLEFQNTEAFKRVHHRVRIIARATPRDKQLLIRGMKGSGGMIGMAGDSIADSPALVDADVGFCMGSGCDVAQDNSDLIVMDNDFASIYKSIRWGKAMFDNARKFIVFQFTVSAAMLVTCFVSAITLGNLPFNVVQMLWLNLVMDILAAIGLGTGCDTARKGRVSRSESVLGAGMWRQIVVQSGYQIVVNLVLVYFGGMLLGKPYNLVTTDPRNPGKVLNDTFIFHTFFMMTMFNQINARTIDENEANVFRTLGGNWIFWLVWVAELLLQQAMLFWASTSATGLAILGMAPLSFELQLLSVVIGALGLGIHALHVKFIPLEHF